jgi:hypothetical protein
MTFEGAPHDQWSFRNDMTLKLLGREFSRQPSHVPGILYQHVSGHDSGSSITPISSDDFPNAMRVKYFLL